MHSGEFETLRSNFKKDPRINIQCRDGLEALNALLPPTPRRGMVFIDPPYEDKSEYTDLVKAVKLGTRKWNTGIFVIWYPVLGKLRDHSKNITQELKRLNLPMLQAELCVEPQDEEFGITQIAEDFYEIYSKSGKYKGSIDMGKNPMLKIEEVK